MFIDTHCHINMMVKKEFDVFLTENNFLAADQIIKEAAAAHVNTIINVGTSLIESTNCIQLSNQLPHIYAAIGIHPNDITASWKQDLQQLTTFITNGQNKKIVGIGECGLDFHYPDYNIQLQKDVFRTQIEMALEYDLALVVHTRDARDETLTLLEEYHHQIKRGVIHCFSEDLAFATTVIDWGFVIGIGGTITYPKNNLLRTVAEKISLDRIVLETDAPFLPPQHIRGKQNHPQYIKTIAEYIAQLRNEPVERVAEKTTHAARILFNLKDTI